MNALYKQSKQHNTARCTPVKRENFKSKRLSAVSRGSQGSPVGMPTAGGAPAIPDNQTGEPAELGHQ